MQDNDYRSNLEKTEDWFIKHKATIWIASTILISLAIICLMSKGKANDVVGILLFYIIGLILWQIRERFRETFRNYLFIPFDLSLALILVVPFTALVMFLFQ